MTASGGTAGGDDPFLERRLMLRAGARALDLLAPRSTFSSGRIDRGTLLLLDHLPAAAEAGPRSFLDLGCGYGALGLAAAARFPAARGMLVDRDLLAIEYARRNAALNGIGSVHISPGLGYRGIPSGEGPFDWILANLPARAGGRVIAMFLAGGARRLAPGGEMRIVAIAPLESEVSRAAERAGVETWREAATPQHIVIGFKSPERPAAAGPDVEPGDEVYERDVIEFHDPSLREPLRLARPTDLADEPGRLDRALPLLARHLPRESPRRALSFRCGYGLLPAILLSRYRDARVAAADRDLLAAAFTRRNGAPFGGRLEVIECLRLSELAGRGSFDLVAGELSPPLGQAASLRELEEARALLAPGGAALLLGLGKQWREFLREAAPRLGLERIAADGASALYRMQGV